MCNLYSETKPVEAMRSLFSGFDHAGLNLASQPTIYPDYEAPIIRNEEGGARLAKVRWGLPSSGFALKQAAEKRAGKLRAKGGEVDFAALLKMEPDGGTTNVRKTDSKHWTRWLGVEHRCLVPWTAFAEPDHEQGGNAWFALDESRPLAFFAGIWVAQWQSVRKVKTGLETIDLFGFLTTEPNAIVGPIHDKAMPVILTEPAEAQLWMSAPWEEAKVLQRPLADGKLKLLKRGVKRGAETTAGGPLEGEEPAGQASLF